jgi:hypothetical protein
VTVFKSFVDYLKEDGWQVCTVRRAALRHA